MGPPMANIIRTALALAALALACDRPEDSPATTAQEPSTAATDASTTGTETGTDAATEAPTTSEAATTDLPPLTTGEQDPVYCIPKEVLGCEPAFDTWCDEVGDLAAQHFDPPYTDIVAAHCAAGTDACTICFAVWSYCDQIGHDCGEGFELQDLCGCLAQAHGEL